MHGCQPCSVVLIAFKPVHGLMTKIFRAYTDLRIMMLQLVRQTHKVVCIRDSSLESEVLSIVLPMYRCTDFFFLKEISITAPNIYVN